ncbi:hypothetical protein ACTXT7_005968 [Hymenolepis weldensis]
MFSSVFNTSNSNISSNSIKNSTRSPVLPVISENQIQNKQIVAKVERQLLLSRREKTMYQKASSVGFRKISEKCQGGSNVQTCGSTTFTGM